MVLLLSGVHWAAFSVCKTLGGRCIVCAPARKRHGLDARQRGGAARGAARGASAVSPHTHTLSETTHRSERYDSASCQNPCFKVRRAGSPGLDRGVDQKAIATMSLAWSEFLVFRYAHASRSPKCVLCTRQCSIEGG